MLLTVPAEHWAGIRLPTLSVLSSSHDRRAELLAAMGLKLADGFAWVPRAMRVDQAATYVGASRSMFLRLVDDGIMPRGVKK